MNPAIFLDRQRFRNILTFLNLSLKSGRSIFQFRVVRYDKLFRLIDYDGVNISKYHIIVRPLAILSIKVVPSIMIAPIIFVSTAITLVV